MIETYVIPSIVFALGIMALVQGAKKPKTMVWVTLLVASLIVWFKKGAVEMLIYQGLFLPLLYVSELIDVKNIKSRHSSIQEKATAYIATLPAFGFYFLFKEKIESKLQNLSPSEVFVNHFEVMVIVLTLLAIFTFLKNRGRRC